MAILLEVALVMEEWRGGYGGGGPGYGNQGGGHGGGYDNYGGGNKFTCNLYVGIWIGINGFNT